MSVATLTLPRLMGAPRTPRLAFYAVAAFAVAILASVSLLGMAATVVLVAVGAAFVAVLRYPFVGISVFLTTFMINYPAAARGAGPITINNLLGGVFLLYLLWDYYLHRDASYLQERFIHVLLGIGVIFLVGTAVSAYTLPDHFVQDLIVKPAWAVNVPKTDYTSRFLFQFFSRIAFVIFIAQFVRTPRQLFAVYLTWLGCILAAVPPALIGYLQSHEADFRVLARVVNWADNANRFAFGLLLGISFFYYIASTSRSWLVKLICAGGMLTLAPIILLSASRSGFLGMGLLSALIAWGAYASNGERKSTREKVTRAVLFLSVAGVVGTFTFFFILSQPIRERLLNLNPFSQGTEEGYKSAEFRAATLKDSVKIIEQHPFFGVGLGNFRWVHKLEYGLFKPPHNSYVWSMSEGGPALVLAYFVFFAMLWRRIGRLRTAYAEHPYLPRFPQFLRVYMTLFLFFSAFADVWLEEHIFMLCAAVILLERWNATKTAAVVNATSGNGGTAPQLGGPGDGGERREDESGLEALTLPADAEAARAAFALDDARDSAWRLLARIEEVGHQLQALREIGKLVDAHEQSQARGNLGTVGAPIEELREGLASLRTIGALVDPLGDPHDFARTRLLAA